MESPRRYSSHGIIYIFSGFTNLCLTASTIPFFIMDEKEMQEFFFRKIAGNSDILGEMSFNLQGDFPRCQKVEDTFEALRIDNMLKIIGAGPANQFSKRLLREYGSIPRNLISKADTIAEEFRKKFQCNENAERGKRTLYEVRDFTSLF